MPKINVHDAKTHFSRLLEKVRAGEELTIARAGKPIAKLIPIKSGKPMRKPGALKGKIKIASDFDRALPAELLRAFEGRK
jgi:prevent-host-death family protein